MQKLKVMGSAPTKKGLTKLINEKLYSTNWIITGDNKPFNTELNQYLAGCFIRVKGSRWQLMREA